MFIDEKIREYIEQEKEGWHEVRKTWEEVKALSRKQKELDNYLSTYTNDSLHQQMKEDFDKVLDNIESLANTFNFKTGIEISMLCCFLIHGGYLTKEEYCYHNKIFDIKEFSNDKRISFALKIFSGIGCCRHTSAFLKEVLDRFNINNYMAPVDTSIEDFNICEIRLFLHDIHREFTVHNHIINYIREEHYNYFLDITSKQIKIFGACNQFAYSLDGYDLVIPLYSYSSSSWNDEFTDYRKVLSISR